MELILVALASALVAGIPAFLALVVIWWLDRYEKEPVWLLMVALLWGAVPTIVLSIIAQKVLEIPLGALTSGHDVLQNFIDSSALAPLTEEGFKGILLLFLYWFVRHEFNGPMDGILYGAAIGFGFSVVEDVLYLTGAFQEGGWEGWGTLAVLRVGLFTLNHSLFTACTGMGLGLARVSKGFIPKTLLALGGFVLAMALHGIHNAGALFSGETDGATLIVAILVDWSGVAILFILGLVFVHREKLRFRELQSELESGLITRRDYDEATRYRTRFAAGFRIFFSSGPFAWFRWYRFIQAIVDLAFGKYSGPSPGETPEEAAARIEAQRQQVRRLRPA